MNGEIWNRDGKDWERLVVRLLSRRYGNSFQEIPDEDGGDYGLEGYSTSDNAAYQCYAADEPVSKADLYEKQRDKITADIRKFIDNKDHLKSIFDHIQIETWILVVPRFESGRLLKHAVKKAKEVRDANLPYVAQTFQIRIMTAEPFAAERAELLRNGIDKVTIEPSAKGAVPEPSSQFLKNLDRKIKAIVPEEVNQSQLKTQFLRHYIESEEVLETLHQDFPEFFNEVMSIREEKERFLETKSLIGPSAGAPPDHLRETLDDLEDELKTRLSGLSSGTVTIISFGTLAGWLLHCLLDFPLATK